MNFATEENRELKMASNSVIIFITTAVLLSVSSFTAEARTRLSPINARSLSLSSSASSKKICKSFVEKRGYICEEHKVTTNDGYILTLQRIPSSRTGSPPTKPPVLLQHGIMADAATWVMTPSNVSLAYILADEGHDVWLANSRGTAPSFSHTTIPSSDSAFWEWSWDELVAFDLPAVFHYVHTTTGQKFHYVGHSLGTLIALASLSEHKFSNVRSAALLSPIAYVNQTPSLLARAAAKSYLADQLYKLGVREFVPKQKEVLEFVQRFCDQPGIDCSSMISILTGPNCCLDPSLMDTYLEYGQQTSMKNMIHLSQMLRTGIVAKFDYGNERDNMNHYRQVTPPMYNLTSIPEDFPLFISYGGNDNLSDVKDVRVLLDCLENQHDKDKLVVQYKKDYAHLDFIFGSNANEAVYYPLMDFLTLH